MISSTARMNHQPHIDKQSEAIGYVGNKFLGQRKNINITIS
jgi:hypothetical protein